jgi:hypothetical protein
MSAVTSEEPSSSTTTEKTRDASPAHLSTINRNRQFRIGLWSDLARDWHLWSSAERATAVFLLIAVTTTPALLVAAGYVRLAA